MWKMHQVLVLVNLEGVHKHLGRFLAWFVIRERPEIVKADERPRSGAHALNRQLLLDPPDERLGEGRAPPCDLIEIAARHRVMSGMEPMAHAVNPQYYDVCRQRVVDAALQCIRGQIGGDVEVRDLGERMDTGVGPT